LYNKYRSKRLQLSYFSLTVKPHIGYDERLKEVCVRGGEKLVLDTTIEGLPDPTIAWTFNGEPLTSNGHTFVETNHVSSRVSLVDAITQQSGVYKIVAENKVGSAEAAFTVTVRGKCVCERGGSE
jgi:hypothetical protein